MIWTAYFHPGNWNWISIVKRLSRALNWKDLNGKDLNWKDLNLKDLNWKALNLKKI